TEDIGIVLGKALNKIVKERRGIKRFSSIFLPMDEALVLCSIDISGRSYLNFDVKFLKNKSESFDFNLIEDFFNAVVNEARITLHIRKERGRSNHHIAEAIFKGFAVCIKDALKIERKGVSSTKGKL
ncbi:MAG: imidazoleglycerol-phosphate dehydratase, partial [Caldiserica bacterium]